MTRTLPAKHGLVTRVLPTGTMVALARVAVGDRDDVAISGPFVVPLARTVDVDIFACSGEGDSRVADVAGRYPRGASAAPCRRRMDSATIEGGIHLHAPICFATWAFRITNVEVAPVGTAANSSATTADVPG